MFIGPWDSGGPWSANGISGVQKFMNRVWGLVSQGPPSRGASEATAEADRALTRAMHKTVKAVTDDMEKFRFNTMLAKLMEYVNTITPARDSVSAKVWSEAVEKLVLMLAPTAPHLAEEAWREQMGKKASVHLQDWPTFDEAMTVDEVITLVVQVNGKVRDKLQIAPGAVQGGGPATGAGQPPRPTPPGRQAGAGRDLRAEQAGQRGGGVGGQLP